MAIRKPSVSVEEAKRLAKGRSSHPAQESTVPSTATAPQSSKEIASTETSSDHQSAGTLSSENPAASEFGEAIFPEDLPGEPKMQVFLSAPLPSGGVSASFDKLSKHYPPGKALQMILRRALDRYEDLLDEGCYKGLPLEYAIGDPAKVSVIQTSRMMPVRLVDVARTYFDPLGFESTRAFGRKLACAALASFFQTEGKNKR